MEEKKEKKKLNKKPLLICLAIALVFALIGIVDINVNAAESVVNGPLIEEQYLNIDYFVYNPNTERTTHGTWNFGVPEYRVAFFYDECHSGCSITSDDSNVIGKGYTLYVDDSNCSNAYYWKATVIKTAYDSDGDEYSSSTDDTAGEYCHTDDYQQGVQWCESGFWHRGLFFEEVNIDTNVPVFKDFVAMQNYLSTGTYNKGDVKFEFDYSTCIVNDDMPTVTGVNFDKIESNVNDGTGTVKTITDYIRFDSNSNYKLVIMLCPSIYSTIGDSNYSSKFNLYDYDNWIYMTTADEGLKEISCELGRFKTPINNVNCITSSNYKGYYEEICYELAENGQLVFKPTMGYRLAYFDETNNIIGPSTYIIPNYYNNLDPDSEAYSYFTLYSDGTRGSEKVMNLKTWEQEVGSSLEDVKEVIGKVEDTMKDYFVVGNDVGVQEATGWLTGVTNFIKGTPALVGSVLGFLPQPILYGMYVCIFLGVIASGLAIVKALL